MSSTSFVISREAILQRRACSPRRKASILTPPPLHIISEEEEYLRSRSPSPMSGYASTSSTSTTPSMKHRRRHCNLSPSDIQIARDFVGIGDEGNTSDSEDRLLLVPPSSARLPKTPSPDPSPDSFRLTFTDKSYTFPHPPIPTPSSNNLNVFCGSPNFSSSGESSPSCSAMPLTPSSSDEDLLRLPSPRWNSRRGAAIQPLVIQPHFHTGIEIEASVPEVYESWDDKIETGDKPASFSLSPYTTCFIDSSSSDSESDNESDSEWYTRELSQVVTVSAPTRSHTQNSRPESMFLPSSKPESTALPQKRASKRYIPNYPPPPPPSRSPAFRRSVSAVPSSPSSVLDFPSPQLLSPYPSSPTSSRPFSPRPPPRNSVPADFSFDDDASSTFSFAMYQVEIDERDAARAVSPASTSFSQSSFYGSEAVYGDNEDDYGSPLDIAEFDLDSEHRMMLPLSLPGTPIDLEADIAHGLEELRRIPVPTSPLPPVLEDSEEEQVIEIPAEESFERPTTPQSRSSKWSFGTASPARSFNHGHGPRPSISFSHSSELGKATANVFDEERVLKSKWSSSTLASVREDHEKRASSRMKLSFLGSSPSKKRTSTSAASPSSSPSKKIPPTPLSPMTFLKKRSSTSRKTEEVQFPPISAFTSPTQGVRRRGSSSTMSDAGSIETTSSTASNGLRRKPIPIELFLRA